MRGAWLICLGLAACPWSAAVDTYCQETGRCEGTGGSAAGAGPGSGGGRSTGGGLTGPMGGGSGTAGGSGSGTGGGTGAAGSGGGVGTGAIGATCTAPGDCGNGLCVDGRCCDGVCNNPCDFCNLPGREGRCEVAPLGREPSTPCSGYFACNGTNSGCPSLCTVDAGCSAARCASGGVCIPKIERLKEDFDAGIDVSLWSFISPTAVVVSGQLNVTTVPNSTQYPGVFSRYRYDLTDSEARIELVNPGNQSMAAHDAIVSICNFPMANRCLNLAINRGQITLELGDNGNFTYPWGVQPLGTKRFLRIRESAGTLYLEAKNTAGVYEPFATAATPLRQEWTDMTFDVGAGTFQATSSASTVIWDNINVP